MTLKWKMIDRNHFSAQHENYSIKVEPPLWKIGDENNKLIDCCYWHPNIATGELQAKAQAERAMDKIIAELNKTEQP
jgi:hypothetical protein